MTQSTSLDGDGRVGGIDAPRIERAVREILEAIGARAWRDRAEAELRASGALPRATAARAGAD